MLKDLKTSALAEATQKPKRDANTINNWGKIAYRRKKNQTQERYLYRIAKNKPDNRTLALKAAGSLHFCNQKQIVEKVGNHYLPAGSWNCGKKYCAICSNKKRKKILRTFKEFFIENEKGKELLKNYDLAMFTITLQHSMNGLRSKPYYKELSTHFRNALKYGAFKKVIAGGFYNTEHTYTKNGHHIHRHALVLIPKNFDIYNNYQTIEEELRKQWKSRTGGSFQIDLRPLGYDAKNNTTTPRAGVMANLGANLLEVTKYITKRDDSGIIDWEIIKAVEQNSRSKFYGRFGILHRIKELNLNQEKENVEVKEEKGEFFTCDIYVKFKKQTNTKTLGRRKITYGSRKGIPVQKVEFIKGETIVTWRKEGIFYTAKNLMKFDNSPQARKQFQENTGIALFKWRLEKGDKLHQGYDVDAWKEKKRLLEDWNKKPNFIVPIQEIEQIEIFG